MRCQSILKKKTEINASPPGALGLGGGGTGGRGAGGRGGAAQVGQGSAPKARSKMSEGSSVAVPDGSWLHTKT